MLQDQDSHGAKSRTKFAHAVCEKVYPRRFVDIFQELGELGSMRWMLSSPRAKR